MRTTIWANSIVWSLSPNESFTRSEDRAVHQLLMMILSWVSERERANLIERTKAGLDRARAEGKILGHVGILTGRGSRSCGGRRSDLGEGRGRPGYEQYPKDGGRQGLYPPPIESEVIPWCNCVPAPSVSRLTGGPASRDRVNDHAGWRLDPHPRVTFLKFVATLTGPADPA